MLKKIPGNVLEDSGNVQEDSGECLIRSCIPGFISSPFTDLHSFIFFVSYVLSQKSFSLASYIVLIK